MIYNRATEEHLDFLYKNIRLGVDFCAKELGVTKLSIIKLAGKHKIRRTLNKKDKDNLVDISNFTSISKPEVAYFLGLLWADGYISENKVSRKVCMELSMEDINEVKGFFTNIVNFSENLRKPRDRTRKPILSLYTGNRPLYDFLKENEYKLKSLKSPCKILSKIPDALKKYFWRGYFDGDGYIHVDEKGRYGFVLAGSFDQDWTAVESLMNSLDIKFSIRRHDLKSSSSKSSEIVCTNRDGFLKFFNYIYGDYDKMGFSRKYNKYIFGIELIKKIHNNLLRRSCPVLCYDKEWNFITRFDSIQEAGRKLSISPKMIREYLRYKRSRCYQYQFKKEREESVES